MTTGNHSVAFDIPYVEERNRGTVAVRLILAIPHMIVVAAWGWFVGIITFVQWFIVLFTGKRNDGIWRMQNDWLGYATRVNTYTGLMFDEYPAFGTDPGGVPVLYEFGYAAEASRLTNALRMFWVIPAAIIMWLYVFAAYFVAIAAWFAIVITGKMPEGMFAFMLKAHRQSIRTQSYGNMMTDIYPNAVAPPV